jgi:branched-chain amino acid transport system substrate-binding protein
MGEKNMKAVAFGINVEGQKDEFWQASAGKANYVATLDTYAEVEYTPKTIAFVQAFKKRYGKAPTYNAATYDAIMMLKAAIEESKSMDADKIVPIIEKSEHVGTGATATFDKRHDLVWAVGKTSGIAVQWQDGKKVPFWPPNIKGMQPYKMPAR